MLCSVAVTWPWTRTQITAPPKSGSTHSCRPVQCALSLLPALVLNGRVWQLCLLIVLRSGAGRQRRPWGEPGSTPQPPGSLPGSRLQVGQAVRVSSQAVVTSSPVPWVSRSSCDCRELVSAPSWPRADAQPRASFLAFFHTKPLNWEFGGFLKSFSLPFSLFPPFWSCFIYFSSCLHTVYSFLLLFCSVIVDIFSFSLSALLYQFLQVCPPALLLISSSSSVSVFLPLTHSKSSPLDSLKW